MNENFLYRDEDHTYWELGKYGEYFQIPGVTSVISKILDYSNVPEEILEEARQRGDNIHKTIKLWHEGMLDMDNLEEGNKIALESYIEWFQKEGLHSEGLICDVKTRKLYLPYDSVQLAGYDYLFGSIQQFTINSGDLLIEKQLFHKGLHFGGTPDFVKYNPIYMHKMILYLKPEGGYEFVPAEKKQAGSVFRKLLKNWWDCKKIEQLIERWKK